jgi:hypothetical protein
MAYIYTPFMKKVLHITKRKRKSNVHHYCKSDDFRAGFKVAKWGTFCHSAWLQISPARFKQVYSDSAGQNDIQRNIDVTLAAHDIVRIRAWHANRRNDRGLA